MGKEMNPLQKFGTWLFNVPMTKERVYAIQAQAKEKEFVRKIASLEAQLGKEKAQKKKEVEEQNDEEREQDINKQLAEQDAELDKNHVGKIIWFGDFYKKLVDKKYKKDFKIYDRNGEVPHKFGDFGLTTKGYFVIADNDKNVFARFQIPKGLFLKNSAIFNYFKDKRIFMGIDKNQNYIPQIDDVEMQIPVFNNDTQEYEMTTELTENAREIIIDTDSKLRLALQKIEALELVIADQKEDLRLTKQSKRLYEKSSDVSRADLSMAMEKVGKVTEKDYKKTGKLIAMSESNKMKDDRLDVHESNEKSLLDKLEDEGAQTSKEKAKNDLKDAVDFVGSIPNKTSPQKT